MRRLEDVFASTALMGETEEEKKALIAMLGKLYITAHSEGEKLQSTIELVVSAINDKIAQDTSSRNALNKIHSALSKALGEASKVRSNSEVTLALSGGDDGVNTQRVEEFVIDDEEDIRIESVQD